jgi:hypothetical protein
MSAIASVRKASRPIATRREPINLKKSGDVASFRGPFRQAGSDETTFEVVDVDLQPIAKLVGAFRRIDAYPTLELFGRGAVSLAQRRLGRLLIAAPQMYAALRLAIDAGVLAPDLAAEVSAILDGIDNEPEERWTIAGA